MEGIDLQIVADALNNMQCNIHGIAVAATVDGEHIKYTACCDGFQEILEAEYNRQVDIQVMGGDFLSESETV